jgi:hypothetical protein
MSRTAVEELSDWDLSLREEVYRFFASSGRYWANCAWDALGIPVVLGSDSRTPTRCAGTGGPVELGVEHGRLRFTGGFVHFAVPPRDFWVNIGFT